VCFAVTLDPSEFRKNQQNPFPQLLSLVFVSIFFAFCCTEQAASFFSYFFVIHPRTLMNKQGNKNILYVV